MARHDAAGVSSGEPVVTSTRGRGSARHRRRQLGADLERLRRDPHARQALDHGCDRTLAYYFHAWRPHQFPATGFQRHPGLMKLLHSPAATDTSAGSSATSSSEPVQDTRVAMRAVARALLRHGDAEPDGRRMTTMQPEPWNQRVAMVLDLSQVPRLPDVRDRLQAVEPRQRQPRTGTTYETWPRATAALAGDRPRRSGRGQARRGAPTSNWLRRAWKFDHQGRDRLRTRAKGDHWLRPTATRAGDRTGRGPRRRNAYPRDNHYFYLPRLCNHCSASGVPRRVSCGDRQRAGRRHRARRPGPLAAAGLRRGLPPRRSSSTPSAGSRTSVGSARPASRAGRGINLCAPVPGTPASSFHLDDKRA